MRPPPRANRAARRATGRAAAATRTTTVSGYAVLRLVAPYADMRSRRRLVRVERTPLDVDLCVRPLADCARMRRVFVAWARARRRQRPYAASFARRLHDMDEAILLG